MVKKSARKPRPKRPPIRLGEINTGQIVKRPRGSRVDAAKFPETLAVSVLQLSGARITRVIG
ncbi:hypothetical protein OG735_41315 (plasmid) [Streptomyces sp. NBC_01210]|uniref:hypothetical protein n=1 Tax=Streptomyces sp. NBC_01210 TaxID=2903774 RepID=UPI002E11B1BD|nr:hypothetical protein OG735_41315 [Streptomyces sp. NBC_01210]